MESKQAHAGYVHGLAQVKLWSVTTGRLLHTYAYHANQVTSVAWMPDGRRFFTSSLDKYASTWHTAHGPC